MSDTIKHHLNDAILMAYSAGTLPEAFNLMVASHLSLCDRCRAQAETFDALGGELLNQQADVSLSGNCLSSTMDLINGGEIAIKPTRHDAAPGILPEPLRD